MAGSARRFNDVTFLTVQRSLFLQLELGSETPDIFIAI
jgi:hypothetical protein